MELGGAGGHPSGAGFGFREVATAGPGDRVGEREGADATVQGSHLTAGAWSDTERSVTSGKSRRRRRQRNRKEGSDLHAAEGVVSKQGI